MDLLGYDIGSSSVKATVLEISTGYVVASATSPDTCVEIIAQKPGWAEQHPDTWWACTECYKAVAGQYSDQFP